MHFMLDLFFSWVGFRADDSGCDIGTSAPIGGCNMRHERSYRRLST